MVRMVAEATSLEGYVQRFFCCCARGISVT